MVEMVGRLEKETLWWTTSDEQGHRVGGLGHGEAGPSSVGLEERPRPQRQDGSDQPHLQLRWLRLEQALTTRSTSRLSTNLDALSYLVVSLSSDRGGAEWQQSHFVEQSVAKLAWTYSLAS